MTLTLILMRHAKSSWVSHVEDHARPLNPRGVAAAKAMGDWLRRLGYLPDAALVSSAARTQETFARLGVNVPAKARRDLYLADAEQMLEALQAQTQATILMIGHNPGIADFAERLVTQAPKHHRFVDYPTGATTVIQWEAKAWNDIGWHTQGKGGQPIDFAIPKDLMF